MMWQMWTAFGIMMGYAMDLAFLNVPDTPNIKGLNWRLMLGSVGLFLHSSSEFRLIYHFDRRPVFLPSLSCPKSFSAPSRPVG